MVWDEIATLYEPRDFTDADGKPVTRDLPEPRRASPASAPLPEDNGGLDDWPL